jgi:outer membrane protein
MQRISSKWRFLVAVLCLFSILAPAQEQDYTKSAPIFPQVWAPYSPRPVPSPSFVNFGGIDSLIHDGKLMLSLDDAVVLALENNLDLVIARYNLPIADTDILRTKSGAAVRGINTGILAGTPGGGVGSIGNTATQGGGAGGTTTAAGGAGTGVSGLVSSTLGVGPPTEPYDPILTSTTGYQNANLPQSSIFIAGVPSLQQNSFTSNFAYNQGFSTGTLFSVTTDNSRVTTNSLRTVLSPQLNTSFLFQVTQHLLQGFSRVTNRRYIIIARNNREIADVAFRLQTEFTVTQIENLYWNLVSAYEAVNASQRAVTVAQQLETNNRKQLAAGTLAMLDVVNAQAQVATAMQNLIIAQTNLQLQQLLMKNAITRNGNDPLLAAATVIPTDTMELPKVEPVEPTQDLIDEALQNRAELAESRIDLTNREITRTSARNALLPAIDFVANYGGSQLGGVANSAFIPFAGAAVPPPATTGFFETFGSMNAHPAYFVGVNVNIPIRNRAAQSDQIRAGLEYQQARARLQQLQNEITIEVRNAQFTLQQNRARVNAAIQARDYQAQVLEAEQKKLAQGISTTFNVLQDMTNLSTAESNLVNAMTAYEQSRVQLDSVTGRTLQALGIDIADAETGKVIHRPHVPGVVPNTEVPPQTQP